MFAEKQRQGFPRETRKDHETDETPFPGFGHNAAT